MEITCPKVVRLRLMPTASLRRCPVAPVLPCLSLPAKSTRLIIEIFSVLFYFCLNSTVMMVWALELVAFICVEAIVLFLVPNSITFWICSKLST